MTSRPWCLLCAAARGPERQARWRRGLDPGRGVGHGCFPDTDSLTAQRPRCLGPHWARVQASAAAFGEEGLALQANAGEKTFRVPQWFRQEAAGRFHTVHGPCSPFFDGSRFAGIGVCLRGSVASHSARARTAPHGPADRGPAPSPSRRHGLLDNVNLAGDHAPLPGVCKMCAAKHINQGPLCD